MPYVPDPLAISPTEISPPLADNRALVDWAATRFILNYKTGAGDLHWYLLRDEKLTGLNDEWRLLSTISTNLDPFLQTFHRLSPHLGSGPSDEVWLYRALLQV